MPEISAGLIEAESVERVFESRDTKVYALRTIDLSIARGEYVSLMGPSGSGKTTLFNIIGALDFPTSGTIRVAGRDLSTLAEEQLAYLRCAHVGYIFQNYNLVEVISALENVTLPMRFLGLEDGAARDKAADLLQLVGLGERMTHLPGELSGGQQQRVAIARALANDPGLILADEPTGNLDSKTGKGIVDLLYRLRVERGVTIISATHDHRMIDVSDRVVYLRDGKIEKILNREDIDVEVGSMEEEGASAQ